MHRLYQKLNSKSGVSILIALVLFLIASMVSVVVIHASLTAIKRVQDDKKREEELLTVSSAARLLEKAIKASDVTVTEVHTETETFTEGGESTVPPPSDTTNYSPSGRLGKLLEVLVKDGFPANETYVVTVDPDWGDEETLPACTFTFTVKPYDASYEDSTDSYKIEGVVETAGSRQKVFLTAWIPITPVPEITHDNKEDQESGVSVKKTVERRVTRYVWSGVELTTMREEWTDNDNG